MIRDLGRRVNLFRNWEIRKNKSRNKRNNRKKNAKEDYGWFFGQDGLVKTKYPQ